MTTKQLVLVLAAIALLCTGIGVVLLFRIVPRYGRLTVDLGNGRSLDVREMADRLSGARLEADEAAAIATLRSLASAQAQVQSAGAIDVDEDGIGEYGYLGELAGLAPLRAPPGRRAWVMDPALLPPSLGSVTPSGAVERSGYCFRMHLPGASAAGGTPGLSETPGAAGAPVPDVDNAEVLWCVYAWPVEAGVTGTRAFFLNQEGDLLETPNADHAYSGESRGPGFDAVWSDASPRDMGASLPTPGARTNDGRAWSIVGY